MEKKKSGSMDPELLTMGRLDRQLRALEPEVRARVVAWLTQRHGTPPPPPKPEQNGKAVNGHNLLDGNHV